MEDIGTLGESVVSQTRTATEGFSGKAECRQAIADGGRELKALAADSNPGLTDAALEAARRDVLAFTQSHYTMACERSVHGVVIDGRRAVELLTGADTPGQGVWVGSPGGGQEPDISNLLL